MSCFDLTHAPVATAARAAATGPVSMSTRPVPEGSGTVEIATRRCPHLRVVWDLRELTHQQKPRLWSLPAILGPVTVHPSRWGVGPALVCWEGAWHCSPGIARGFVAWWTIGPTYFVANWHCCRTGRLLAVNRCYFLLRFVCRANSCRISVAHTAWSGSCDFQRRNKYIR